MGGTNLLSKTHATDVKSGHAAAVRAATRRAPVVVAEDAHLGADVQDQVQHPGLDLITHLAVHFFALADGIAHFPVFDRRRQTRRQPVSGKIHDQIDAFAPHSIQAFGIGLGEIDVLLLHGLEGQRRHCRGGAQTRAAGIQHIGAVCASKTLRHLAAARVPDAQKQYALLFHFSASLTDTREGGDFFHESPMNALIARELGMKGCRHVPALLHQHGRVLITRQNARVLAETANDRGANEHRLQFPALQPAPRLRMQAHDAAVDLPSVGIALHIQIHQPQRALLRPRNTLSQQDGARAGAENRLLLAETAQWLEQVLLIDQLEHGRALAAGDDQAIDISELRRRAHRFRLRTGAPQCIFVGFEIALEREHADAHCRAHYQPRVWSSSLSGSCETSRPGIPMPSSSLASSSFSGSLKYVAAFTMAFARASGSDDLNIPEPTNTASAPSCMTSAASAGVAMPPAEKFGTGSLPCSATYCTSSRGACSFLASATSSSRPSTVSCFISFTMVRMCRTASTMFPEPASPLVRIIAAPSAIRRSASPRLRAPHTNGTLKSRLSMWCSSSAGVSTSLSSM